MVDKKVVEPLTHRELCLLGAKWLKKECRCTIAIHDPKGIRENPDTIGWRYSWGGYSNEGSILIECKRTRADFKKDFTKPFRVEPELGIGNWRYYMCPTGLIKPEEIPDKWGLLYVCEKRRITAIKHPYKTDMKKSKHIHINTENERYILTRWLSKTENPEKVMLMLRESNNKLSNMAKQNDNLRASNKKLQQVSNILNNLSLSTIDSVNTTQDIMNQLSRLSEMDQLLQLYETTGKDHFIQKALKLTKENTQ